MASVTMILLAALLCNYGRGSCLIDVGTEGDWLNRQWEDIKGNVKYALLLFLLAGVGTVVANVTRGLQWWQFSILVACFLLLFAWAVIVTFRSKPTFRPDAAKEDHEVRITIVEGALAERPSPNTLLPYVYLLLKVRVLASKNTTLDLWKLVLTLEGQSLCTPDLNFDEGLVFQEIQEPAPSLPGRITTIEDRRLNQVSSEQTVPQNSEIEGWIVFRAANNIKFDDILGATLQLSAYDINGKPHGTTRIPGTWRRRVTLVGPHPNVPSQVTLRPTPAAVQATTPHLVCEGIIRELLIVGQDHHHADALIIKNDVTTQRAVAHSVIASAVYSFASGRTARVDHMKWIEDNPQTPYAWSIEMGMTGHLVIAAYVQRDKEWTFYAAGYKKGLDPLSPNKPVLALHGLEMGAVKVDISIIGEGVRERYFCEGTLSSSGAEWKQPEKPSSNSPQQNRQPEILTADWGIGGPDYKDKKELLTGYLEARTPDLRASNQFFHDDYPNEHKHLMVRYRWPGSSEVKTRTLAQNDRITFS